MRLNLKKVKLVLPGIPPNPPSPNGEAATSGAGAGDGVDPAIVVVVVDVAVLADEDAVPAPEEEAAPPCLITRWIVIPSLMLCDPRFSESFRILPAKMRHKFSMGALLNLTDMASLN